MQNAIDAEADCGNVALGLQMNVGRALIECVLPQPVDDVDDVLVVGVDLFVGLAKFNQLLEIIAQRDVLATGLVRALDRFCE